MSAIIDKDVGGNPIIPSVVLATKSGKKLGTINGITGLNIKPQMNNPWEISFAVQKNNCNLWDEILDGRLLYVHDYDRWFEISLALSESEDLTLSITGTQAQQMELSQYLLYDVYINTEDDIARDDYTKPTLFYRADDPENSLLNRILKDKAPHWSIYHVDDSLMNINRQFSFDGKTIYDALQEIAEEVECLFVFGESGQDNTNLHRTISAYDLDDYCLDCGKRGTFGDTCPNCGSENIIRGYGEDTGVFVSSNVLGKDISYSSNLSQVKNCFHLEGGDDVISAAIHNINPNGSNYIWYFTDAMRKDMSDELRAKLAEYEADYGNETSTTQMPKVSADSIATYNSLVNKYLSYAQSINDTVKWNTYTYPITGYTQLMEAYYNASDLASFLQTTMMPDSTEVTSTTAEQELAKLTTDNMSPLGVTSLKNIAKTSMTIAVTSYARVYVDTSRYRIDTSNEIVNTTAHTWTGTITLTSYTDDDDVASKSMTITFTESTSDFIKQKIDKAMRNSEDNDPTAHALLKNKTTATDLLTAINDKYSVDALSELSSVCQAAIDIMLQEGISEASDSLHASLYTPYVQKKAVIESELTQREKEVASLNDGFVADIFSQIQATREKFDMETYLGTDLWNELCLYRRDNDYTNSNFISDGLTEGEIISKAQEFLEAAQKELVKSATLQHTISATLNDLLVLDEFKPLLELGKFQVGNYIRVRVDDEVYRLRLLSYTINYDSLETLDVEFSDMIYGHGLIGDIQSILDSAKQISVSYAATMKKAKNGEQAREKMLDIASNGLALTNQKIINNADNQDLVIDEHGILMRRKNDFTEGYNDEQIRLINNGLYYTKDGWKTASAGVGHFKYYDPEDGTEKDGYGVVADTIVGNIVLSNQVGIYNESGSLKMDENGLVVTSSADSDTANLFTLQKENKDGSYTKYIYVDDDGNFAISGNTISISAGDNIANYVDSSVSTAESNIKKTTDEAIAAAKSEIKVTTDGITATVEQNQKTLENEIATAKTEIKATTDALKVTVSKIAVGGRNYALNSSLQKNVDGWALSGLTATSGEITMKSGYNCLHLTGISGYLQFIRRMTNLPVTNNSTVTLSAYILAENIVESSASPQVKLYQGSVDSYISGSKVTYSPVIVGNTTGEATEESLADYNGKGWTHVSLTWEYSAIDGYEWQDIYHWTSSTEDVDNIGYVQAYIMASNFTGDLYIRNVKLEIGNKATDWTSAPEDVDGEISTVQAISENAQDRIDDAEDQITNINSTIATYKTNTDSTIATLRSDTEAKYNELIEYTNSVVNAYKSEVAKYLTFDAENGLTLGAITSDGKQSEFKTVIDNNSLTFKQGDTDVAWIDNNWLNINNAKINNALLIGNFYFHERADGGVSLSWLTE